MTKQCAALERVFHATDRQFFDEAAIAKLADLLTDISGKPITVGIAYETDDFWTRMEYCAHIYLFVTHYNRELPSPNPKQELDAYQKLANSVSKARGDLEALLDEGLHGLLYAAAAGNLRDHEARAKKIENVRQQIEELEGWVTIALENVETDTKSHKGGRPKTSFLSVAVRKLAHAYEEYTGRRVGVSNDPVNECKGGPFVRFVEAFLEHVEPGVKRKALGQTIRNILAKDKFTIEMQRRISGNITRSEN